MEIKLDLDELLDLICPLQSKENVKKKRPDALLRSSFFGEEPTRFSQIPLTLALRHGEKDIHITGICDGVQPGSDLCPYTVEEELLVDRILDSVLWRERLFLRAKFLALALCNTKELDRIKLRLSVFGEGRMETEEHLMEKSALSRELALPLEKILSLVPLWQPHDTKIQFPHDHLREGQKELIHAAWDAIKSKTKLFACAPTGIGKTLAVLYPALRALETGRAKKVFYASPKNTLKMQAAAAVESLQQIRGLRTLVMDARMSLCPEKKEECEKESCPYAITDGSRLTQALSFLSAFSCITRKELTSAAVNFHVCPFELAKKMASWCHVIIGDYNHIFDPNRSVFSAVKGSVLLVDEAHNLPGRIRESFTESIAPRDLDYFFRDETAPSRMLREHFAPLTAIFTKIDKNVRTSHEYFSFAAPDEMGEAVKKLLPKIAFAMQGGFGIPTEETDKALKALYRKCKKFAALYRIFDKDFSTVYPPDGGCRIYLTDPREKIRKGTEGWTSSLFFSATLQPKDYYFRLLAGEEEDTFLELDSPFPTDNLFVGICPVDVSHSQRFATAPKICSIIHSAVNSREGNYMVFLPSFEYLNLVSQEYKRRFFQHRILVQEKVMTAQKRKEFLSAFEKNRKGTLIGFCVMGGIFSEGVDLKGDSLSGEIIVGTGFPPPSPESEAECALYYKMEMDGKSFAYTLPGWSRVLQAAGRVIRDENDRGFLILCDARYQGEDMKELFPSHWDEAVYLERDAQLKQKLEQFWK